MASQEPELTRGSLAWGGAGTELLERAGREQGSTSWGAGFWNRAQKGRKESQQLSREEKERQSLFPGLRLRIHKRRMSIYRVPAACQVPSVVCHLLFSVISLRQWTSTLRVRIDLTPLVLLASSPKMNSCPGALCLFARSLRRSSNKHLLSASCVPGTAPGRGFSGEQVRPSRSFQSSSHTKPCGYKWVNSQRAAQ